MDTIIFDVNCVNWSPNGEYNRFYLNTQCQHFQELCKYRGYLYLNYIYETLGAKWNPDWENVCYRIENGPLRMKIEEGYGDVYFIEIGQ